MEKRTVTILCSGFGLGLYIPGLLAARRLEEKNVPTCVEVFENLISEDKRENIRRSRKAYHGNFALAQMSARMPMDIRKSMDRELVDRLLEVWLKEDRRDFIILSGHWLYVMEEYRTRSAPGTLNAEILYVDCDLPPSWKSLQQYVPDYNTRFSEFWLYDFENMKLQYQIPVSKEEPLPYSRRPDRFIIHGGGWGMGTYRSKIPQLRSRGLSLDIVAYELQEAMDSTPGDRSFMVDPNWCAWNKNKKGVFEFPPIGEICQSRPPFFSNKYEYHDLFDVTATARAIVGKPGAGTMMDSLASATPLIMLEPFGEHEKKNTGLWENLGFGISYTNWEAMNFSMEILERLHENLLIGRNAAVDFTEAYKLRNNL